MSDTDLAYLPATEIRSMIAERQVSSFEMTKLYLDRIASLDSQFNSYLTVTADLALEMAEEADRAVARGDDLGPLHGLPISIKDLEMTEGIRTTSGSLIFADRIAAYDSVVVERVKKAGAVILGKTNTPEYGLLGHTENRLGDHCRNPWNTDRTTGGSSGGAGASVAAGLCALATGSDGGGSIRIPAGFCGIYGIKPTQGRISYYLGPGADPAVNLFSQPGPMTRTVADSAVLLQVLAGRDPRDPGALRDEPDDYVGALSRGVEGMKIGWSADFGFAAVEPEVRDSAAAAAMAYEDLGAVVEEIDFVLDTPFEQFWPLFTAIMYARVAGVVDEHWDKLTWYAQDSLATGKNITGAEFVNALGHVDAMKSQFADAFDEYDLILTPTLSTPAFPVGEPPAKIGGQDVHWFWGYTPYTMPINMIGSTAASIPCGFSSDGLPIGLHIIGDRGAEAKVFAASAAFEEARPWIQHRPPAG
ncbi:MAG: amidase [Chloroflexi bacterium]|nr:amidase [Chloroflexota bacterium]